MKTCEECGGLIATEHLEKIAGTLCRCGLAPATGSTRPRGRCPLCARLEGDAHDFFCRGRKIDGRWVGGHKKVDNAVTRAGEGLRVFVETMERMPRVTACNSCGQPTTRSSGICYVCIRAITAHEHDESNKRVTVHTLRHSFATAFLVNGGSIHQLKELLGHRHLETTEIYTHCIPQFARTITSPLDVRPNVVPFNAPDVQAVPLRRLA